MIVSKGVATSRGGSRGRKLNLKAKRIDLWSGVEEKEEEWGLEREEHARAAGSQKQ